MTTAQVSAQLRVLDLLMAVANASKNAEEILAQSLASVCEAYSAKAGAAYVVREGRLHLAALRGLERQEPLLERLEHVDRLWRRCILAQDILSLPVSEMSDPLIAASLAASGCTAVLALPLLAHTEPVGCLVLGTETSTIDELDHDFMRTMGRAIGLALDNASLYEQMDHRLRESETLYEISRAFSSTLDLDALLHLIVRLAVDTLTNADNGVLHLLDEQTGELHPRALSFVGEVRPDRSGRSRMRIGEGLAGIALQEGELMNIPDVSKDPRFVRVGEVRRFASMVVAPLKMGTRRLGTLSVDSKRANAFGPNEERLLITLAAQAAAALENARLVHDLHQTIIDLKQTQAQLIQSAKLSAIGQLIAGVAHELNNPLTAVMGYTQLAQSAPGIDEAMLRDLDKIYTQAGRAARIVQNLLTFAREYKGERQRVDINEVLRRTLELRLYQLRVDNIDVQVALSDEPLLTAADGNQLQQVFLNLINNAQDAMVAHRGGGCLRIASSRVDDTICVDIADTGHGMTADVLNHLFEPFFTTKEVGKGTGLGLSICFGIISEHGGQIKVESQPGTGTTFHVLLPVVQAEAASSGAKPPAPAPRTRHLHILVVDDEGDVAGLLGRALVGQGHQVVLTSNGQEALDALVANDGRPFDLILSDIKMPGLDGPQMYARLQEVAPALSQRIIFITGDTLSTETSTFLQHCGLPHLEKPFNLAELTRIMVAVAEQQRVSGAGAA